MSKFARHFTGPFLIAALTALWAQACLGQDAKAAAEQPPGYASPAEAFAAFQQGWKDGDGETVYRCVTDRHRDLILLGEWCREFTLRFPGPQIKQIVSKHVDEKRRQELTREELPLRRFELASALVRSLKDQKTAFVDLVQNLDERSRGEYTDGKLGEVSIDGNRAQGVLKVKDDPRRIVCHFVKVERGWRFERVIAGQAPLMVVRPARGDVSWLSEGEPIGDAPPDAEKSSPPSKPWTDKPGAKFASPQEAVDAFQNALWENDPEAAWNCLTPNALGKHEWWLWLGMMGPNAGPGATTPMVWYHDIDKWFRLVMKQGQAPTEEDELRAFFESIRDRKVYFSAGIKRLSELVHAVPKEHRKRPKLRDLQVKEDQATGVMTLVLGEPPASRDEGRDEGREAKQAWSSTDLDLTFKKSDDDWRIDSLGVSPDNVLNGHRGAEVRRNKVGRRSLRELVLPYVIANCPTISTPTSALHASISRR